MRRLAQLSLFLICSGICSAPLRAAPTGDANKTTASLPANDPGYIEEDPVLAKLVGKPAPALTLKFINGKPIDLAHLYGKHPYI